MARFQVTGLPGTKRAPFYKGPGSNGFFRREMYYLPGTYTFTARKTGKVKIQALGAAGGASHSVSGTSGAFGEKELSITKGDTLTIVIGQGSSGVSSDNGTATASPGSTSVSGTPVGGTPLVLSGGGGTRYNGGSPVFGSPGTASGPWDLSYSGAAATATNQGSPSSASPFGPGFTSSGSGGAGWGGTTTGGGGASTHYPGSSGPTAGATARAGTDGVSGVSPWNTPGETKDWWDMRDVDSGSGGASSTYAAVASGPGAGASAGSGSSRSFFGGGSPYSGAAAKPPRAGNGAGGGSQGASVAIASGDGGNGLVYIFWDTDEDT